jgi:hypothetical protein
MRRAFSFNSGEKLLGYQVPTFFATFLLHMSHDLGVVTIFRLFKIRLGLALAKD